MLNEEILDASIVHEIELRRFSNATLRKIIALLGRSDLRITNELKKRDIGSQSFSNHRLQLLLAAIRKINVRAYRELNNELRGDIRALARHEGEFQSSLLANLIPLELDIVSPPASALYAAVNSRPFQGRFLRDNTRDLEPTAFKRLRDTIRAGYIEGRTTDQIIRDVRGTKSLNYKDGILERNRRSVTTTVRTALNHTANSARNHLYQENEDLIKGVRWVATLDGRTSLVCQGRDGKVYPIDSGPRPPAHPNCRSTTAPVVKSWKELGLNIEETTPQQRASMNGQVPAATTYQEWLKRRPVGFQNEVLGPTKAKLFRKGELPLDRFVDRSGQEYTIAELRIREASAFEKAGIE